MLKHINFFVVVYKLCLHCPQHILGNISWKYKTKCSCLLHDLKKLFYFTSLSLNVVLQVKLYYIFFHCPKNDFKLKTLLRKWEGEGTPPPFFIELPHFLHFKNRFIVKKINVQGLLSFCCGIKMYNFFKKVQAYLFVYFTTSCQIQRIYPRRPTHSTFTTMTLISQLAFLRHPILKIFTSKLNSFSITPFNLSTFLHYPKMSNPKYLPAMHDELVLYFSPCLQLVITHSQLPRS